MSMDNFLQGSGYFTKREFDLSLSLAESLISEVCTKENGYLRNTFCGDGKLITGTKVRAKCISQD